MTMAAGQCVFLFLECVVLVSIVILILVVIVVVEGEAAAAAAVAAVGFVINRGFGSVAGNCRAALFLMKRAAPK